MWLDRGDADLQAELEGRRLDPETGFVYSPDSMPTDSAVLGRLRRRPQDEPRIIASTIAASRSHTEDVVGMFEDRVVRCNASRSQSELKHDICNELEQRLSYLVVIMLGGPFSGAHRIADAVARQSKLVTLSVEDTINSSAKDHTNPNSAELAAYMTGGIPIGQQLLVKAVLDAMEKCGKRSFIIPDLVYFSDHYHVSGDLVSFYKSMLSSEIKVRPTAILSQATCSEAITVCTFLSDRCN